MVFTFLFVAFGRMHIFLNHFFDHLQVMMPPTTLGCQDGGGSDASGALYRCSVSWNPMSVWKSYLVKRSPWRRCDDDENETLLSPRKFARSSRGQSPE